MLNRRAEPLIASPSRTLEVCSGFDIVAVGVEDEGAIEWIAPYARRAVIASALGQRDCMKVIHCLARRRAETYVNGTHRHAMRVVPKARSSGGHYKERRLMRARTEDEPPSAVATAVVLPQPDPERRENRLVEAPPALKLTDYNAEMVEHERASAQWRAQQDSNLQPPA